MCFALFGILAIYGTWRLVQSWQTGVFQLRFSTVSRADQPGQFASNIAFLATGVGLAWFLVIQQVLAMHFSISFSRAA